MTAIFSSFSTIWRLAAPYFYSEDRWPGRILLAAVIAVELSLVGITVLLTYWQNSFYNALQGRDWDVFVNQLIYFCFLATCATVLQVYKLYLNQWLQIRWRRWMTRQYLNNWLDDSTHYRMQLLGNTADNPDQRIAEDIRMFIERTLTIGAGLMSAIVTLVSFIVILWTLSNAAPFELFGFNVTAIPGYLVWAALIYAIAGTAFTHWIGWPLVPLNFDHQRYEADFRFNLIRVLENSEQIAMLGGEKTESNRLYYRFGKVVDNWHQIMSRQKKLTFFTTGYTQVIDRVPHHRGQPGLLLGRDPARRTGADLVRLQQRAELAVVLHHDLQGARRVARGDRPARRLRALDRGRAGHQHRRSAAGRHRNARDQDRPDHRGPVGAPAVGRAARHQRQHRASKPASMRWCPAPRAAASRRSSAPSPACGRSRPARSWCRKAPS